jgi:hypothetical protein
MRQFIQTNIVTSESPYVKGATPEDIQFQLDNLNSISGVRQTPEEAAEAARRFAQLQDEANDVGTWFYEHQRL